MPFLMVLIILEVFMNVSLNYSWYLSIFYSLSLIAQIVIVNFYRLSVFKNGF